MALRKGRIPTFDQGAIPRIRNGAIRVIDGNQRALEAFRAAPEGAARHAS